MDQAGPLRDKVEKQKEKTATENRNGPPGPLRVIAIASGKGGVGKTNIAANLGITLAKKGKRVLIMDADLGLANIDILLGLSTPYNIEHILTGERTLREVLVEGPHGIRILPASSGVERMTMLTEAERIKLLNEFEEFDDPIDVLIVDTGAGISPNVMYFTVAAQQILVVATPEPTSITDAYALMKVLSTKYQEKRFLLVANNVANEKVARKIYQNIATVAAKFLDISLDLLGYIPSDAHLPRAVRSQQAVVEMFPESEAAQAFDVLADRLLATRVPSGPKGNIQFMWRQVLRAG